MHCASPELGEISRYCASVLGFWGWGDADVPSFGVHGVRIQGEGSGYRFSCFRALGSGWP